MLRILDQFVIAYRNAAVRWVTHPLEPWMQGTIKLKNTWLQTLVWFLSSAAIILLMIASWLPLRYFHRRRLYIQTASWDVEYTHEIVHNLDAERELMEVLRRELEEERTRYKAFSLPKTKINWIKEGF